MRAAISFGFARDPKPNTVVCALGDPFPHNPLAHNLLRLIMFVDTDTTEAVAAGAAAAAASLVATQASLEKSLDPQPLFDFDGVSNLRTALHLFMHDSAVVVAACRLVTTLIMVHHRVVVSLHNAGVLDALAVAMTVHLPTVEVTEVAIRCVGEIFTWAPPSLCATLGTGPLMAALDRILDMHASNVEIRDAVAGALDTFDDTCKLAIERRRRQQQ